jgi:capsular polysaccharide biosynthesis protein
VGETMENVNIKEVLNYLLSKAWLIVVILLTVLAGGEVYTALLKTPLYESKTNVVLISDSSSKQITTNDVTLSNNLVKTYSEIVKSRSVLNKVIEKLKLSESYEGLAGKITVSSVTSTQLITIRISDKDSAKAKTIANEVAKVFKSEIKDIYGIDNVQIVDEAVEAGSAYNINIIKETIIYLIAGLAIGVGVAYVMYLLDKSIKDSETVEDKLGLTVIGVVPEVERE